jgi:DNA-binding IclR family transcriptional regulator
LVKLAAEVRETVNLAVLDDNKVLYIDKVLSDRPFGFNARIGSRLPVHLTALGRVLVAAMNPQERDDVIRAIRHETVDPDSPRPPSVTTLRQLLRQTREQGFALDLGEYLPDVSCIAMEVRGANHLVLGAISITTPTSRFPVLQDSLLNSIRNAATTISLVLRELGIVDLRSVYHGYVNAEA